MAGARNGRVAARLAAVVGVMLGLSFAAVPFYDWFCRVTGFGGAVSTAAAPDGPARADTVLVRFDANVAPDLAVEFRPTQRTLEVRLDEEALTFFEAHNPTDAPIAVTSSFNVAPYATGSYFAKIDCFCFERQELAPGERVEMPVSFFVDPAMLEDLEARGVRQITLSYTMYAADPPAEAAAAPAGAATLARVEAPSGPQAAPRAQSN